MNFKQLVLRNVFRNGRAYASYFLSSLFSVMVFFIFALLYFHPALQKSLIADGEILSVLAKMGISVSQVLIVMMSFIFLWYTFSIFLKSRKRDFSVYLILGMSEKDLRKMIFLENIILGVGTIVTGILVSLFFSKVILLISQNILALDQGMPFYFPIKPILLTVFAYAAIFLLIALMTTRRIQTENLSELSKSEDKPLPLPKAKWYLILTSSLCLGGGYGTVLSFVFGYRNGMAIGGLSQLIVGVLLTVAGTYFFFTQTSIYFLTFLRRGTFFFKRTNMLTISNLIYRMRSNATMYFMIAIVASVAFVGIGTTMAVGGTDFATTQESSFAYVYMGMGSGSAAGETSKFDQENVAFIKSSIEADGFRPYVVEALPLGIEYRSQGSKDTQYVEVIPLSLFNNLAKVDKQAELTLTSETSMLLLANSNGSVNEIKADELDRQESKGEISYQLGGKFEPISYKYSTRRFNIAHGELAVVSDRLYQKILKEKRLDYAEKPDEGYVGAPVFIIHYPEWAEGSQSDQQIRERLSQLEESTSEALDQFLSANPMIEDEELPKEKQREFDAIIDHEFYYTSMYQTWRQTKQGNGLILLISVLLGAVFFTFAACILYFRLFGELDRDGKFHRSLHLLGVSQKERHKIATREMLVMYFVPIVIAVCHFTVAMISLRMLIELPIFIYVARIILSYLVFQLSFFVISRWRYLKHLDVRAEATKLS